MKILQVNKIEENVVSTVITVELLGTADLTEEEEKEQLHNFSRSLEYTKIGFKANMKMIDGVPVIAGDGDSDVQEVTLELINKVIPLDENFTASLHLNVTKIPSSELGAVFTTVEELGQAKIVLFATKVKDEITRLLAEIRAMANNFEGEIEYTL